MMKRGREYTGILAEPIDARLFRKSTVAEDAMGISLAATLAELIARKIEALYQHYGIEQSNPDALVFEMAVAHVPGFQVKSFDDPREWWNSDRLMRLDATVEQLRPRFKSKRKGGLPEAVFHEIATNAAYRDLTQDAGKDRLKEVYHRKARNPEFNPWLEMLEHLQKIGWSDEVIETGRQLYLKQMAHPASRD